MKRILSLVLAMVMVLGSFSAVFAAEQTAAEKAGAFLKEVGVLQGNASGDLMLDKDLRREDALVLLSRLMGVEETAKGFPTTDFPFKDVTDKNYEGFIAWAISSELTQGVAANRFGFKQDLKAQDFATFLLRALGYEATGEAYDKALETAKELGLLADVEVENKTVVTRGTMAAMTFNALGTKMKDSTTTLADKLEIEMPAPELSKDIEITEAKAVANNKVEVKVKEEVAASLADFVIVKKGSTTELEIKDLVKESAKVFVLETEALAGGTSYTVKSNGKSINFTGIAVDKTAPTVKSAAGHDTNRFKVTFSDVMDKATAQDVENYELNKDLAIVKATLSSDRKSVILETDAAKKNTTYKLTIENVLNSDGVVMKKTSHNVRAIEYIAAPTIKGAVAVKSSTLVELTFNEGTFGMNKESLEAVENYTIEGLKVTEAKAYDLNNDGLYETLLLTTEEQEANKSYKLTVAGVTDNSVLKNVIKTKTISFRGMRADKTPPSAVKAEGWNANEVEVTFSDTSAMGIGSMTDISNYKITYRDGGQTVELAIIEAEAWAESYPNAYKNDYKGVTLTTEEQDPKVTYTIEVSDVEDEYGNAMKTTKKLTFKGTSEDLTPPTVKSVKHTDKGVVIEFSERLNKEIAIDPTNYVIDGSVGAAIKATASKTTYTNDTITLVTGDLTANKTYKITIDNIEDLYGNVIPTRTVSFVAKASSLDTTAPSFSYAYAENSEEVHISFDEAIGTPAPSIQTVYGSNNVAGPTLTHSGTINDGTTVVYKTTNLANETYKFLNAEFKDAAGNKVDIKDETFVGIKDAPNYAPIVDYVEQTDAKTVVVYFNEPVSLTWTAPGVINADYPDALDISSLDSHGTEWEIRFGAALKYDTKYKFEFTAKDLAGAELKYDTAKPYEFKADYYDDIAPSIVDVIAVNKRTVQITFDEEVSYAGAYTVTDENNKPISVTPTYNKETVTLKLGTDLKADYLYTLTVTAGAKDLAGNTAEKGEWGDFVGTNVEATNQYIAGVALINANKIRVTANFNLTGITVSGAVYNAPVLTSNNTVATITTKTPFLAKTDYTVTADGKTYTFTGLIEDLGIGFEVAKDTSDNVVTDGYSVTYYGKGSETYNVEVIGLDGTPITETAATTTVPAHYVLTANTEYYVVLKDVNTDSVLYAKIVEAK